MNTRTLKKLRQLGVLAALVLVCQSALAIEKDPIELSDEIDQWYREALVYYQKGRYEDARKRLDSITETIETNIMVELWRENTHARPKLEDVKQLRNDVVAHIDQERLDQFDVSPQPTPQQQAEAIAASLEEERKQAMLEAQEEVQRRVEETKLEEARLARFKEEELARQQLEEERRIRQEELARQQEEQQARRAMLLAQKEEEQRQREEELARQAAEQQARQEELVKQKEEARRQRAEELARQKEERLQRRELLLAQREEERQRRLQERARIAEERAAKRAIALQSREEALRQREEELAKRKEEAARLKEERIVQEEAERAAREEQLAKQQEAEQSQRQEALAKAEAARQAEQAAAAAEQQQAQQVKQARLAEAEAARKVQEQDAAQQEELRLARLEADRQARQEEAARKQKEAQAQEQKRLALQQESEKQVALLQEAEKDALKQPPKQEAPAVEAKSEMPLDEEIRYLELAVARMKEEGQTQSPKPAVPTAGKEAERAIVRIDDMSKEFHYQRMLDEQRMRRLLADQHGQELLREQARLEQMRLIDEQRFQRERQLEEERSAHERTIEEQRRAREEARLEAIKRKQEMRQARLEERELRRQEAEQARLERQQQLAEAKQERSTVYAAEIEAVEVQRQAELDAQRQKEMELQAKQQKHVEDAEKIRKIERIWKDSKRLYRIGMFEESIDGFKEVIKLEGNPRIKYTPEAKRLITEAEKRIIERDQERERQQSLQAVERSEKEMMQAVLDRQVPPYVDPPQKMVEQDEDSLIEPPQIRKKLASKKVTMDFDKVGLKSVMRFLSQESGVNFVSSQKVLNADPVVTARFTDTPLLDVVKYITKSLGLVHRIDKDVIWIADPEEIANEEMETRVYYLRKGGGLFTNFSPVSGGGDTTLGGSSASINEIYTIEDTLKEMVPWPGDAKLTYDKRLNALIVRNTPQNLQMMEDIIYNLDIEPCQILIEARFIEIELTDLDDLGFEWKLTDDFAFEQEDGQFKWGLANGSGIDFSSFTRAAEGLNLTYAGVLTEPQFEMVIHALEENKKVKTLSSPRITTLNNQMASIKVVDEWIYPTRYEFEVVQSDINGDGDFSDAGETVYKNVPKDFLRRDVGILLKVIPAVGSDRKTISLSLIPEVSDATADFFSYTGDVSLPKFTSRNLATSVVVQSSDTVVLGGLISESRTKTETKVPLLGDIPFIGGLFTKNADTTTRKNLLIFVTAKVLNSSGEEVVMKAKK